MSATPSGSPVDDGDRGFGVDHLPWGSCMLPDGRTALCTRLGERVLDVAGAARDGLLPAWLDGPSVDVLLARPSPDWGTARRAVRELVLDGAPDGLWHDRAVVVERLPFTVADYVDFYSSQHHATRVGRIFRPDGDPLPPQWHHLPIGYHGRAGTVVVSGTPVVRPTGQRGPGDVGPTQRLDHELELGFVVGGPPTQLGAPVPIDQVEDHLLGVVLLDDWSARDVQAFEYRPLGPFLGKSFATSIGAWVTPLEALQRAKVPAPVQRDPVPPDHLQLVGDWLLDLVLQVTLSTPTMRERELPPHVLAEVPAAGSLHWTAAQQLAHLTSNGATVRPGDLFATGTVSGPDPGQSGCLLELTEGGTAPVVLPTGESRTYLLDGDELVLSGTTRDGVVALAEVVGRVMGRP